MNFDKLVELITSEVMKKLNQANIRLEKVQEKKLLFLGNRENEAYKLYEDDLKAFGYKVMTLEDNEDIKSYDVVLMPSLNIKELSNLALGLPNGINEENVINALMNGIPVYVQEENVEYKNYSNTANKVFFKMYLEYENKLKDFGINIDNTQNILNSLKDEKNKKKNPQINSVDKGIEKPVEEKNTNEQKKNAYEISNKTLVSEKEIRSLYREGIRTIIIPKKVLITPLAKDFARINHVEIIREK
ncbi:hypothetical protein HAHI6034_08265 [Hathewaya histolytica]|uniref:Ethanolamine utilization protein n=1 Tax=Hathewaya histolytica TaxID=1498 RepID=A0A4U9R1B0_HATHI|nr:hypothetical protein [Hathewaya histolytica]VTQ84749.1 ethanolamine utilization protein [Hathewaya histolytica]